MSTSYLSKAHDFSIGNLHIEHHTSSSKGAFERLEEFTAVGALSNSNERCDAPKCHPETRVAVQDEILSWVEEQDITTNKDTKKMLWMSGPAGTGKTAIAGSVADTCRERGILAASFFFSSYATSAKRRSKRFFIPTLAYQLFQHEGLSGLRELILTSIDKDPAVLELQLVDRLEELVLKPLWTLRERKGDDNFLKGIPKVIIVDGLDECEAVNVASEKKADHRKRSEADQVEVLSALHHASLSPSFPFRILIASRPETAITSFFRNSTARDLTTEIFLDEKYGPDADIALFLRSKFSELCRRYQIPSTWPGEKVISLLVERASGQFIYAATVVRYVQDGSHLPQDQLQRVVTLSPLDKRPGPFAELDALYTHIMNSSPDPERSISWIQCFKHVAGLSDDNMAFSDHPAVFFRQFFETKRGETEHLFGNLRSLIYMPDPEDETSVYKVYHKSLGDFFSDPDRCANVAPEGDEKRGEEWYRAFYRCLESRGPPAYPNLDTSAQELFWKRFQGLYPVNISPPRTLWSERRVIPRDAISEVIDYHISSRGGTLLKRYFNSAHIRCHWSGLRCIPECKAWRGVIRARCRANGWGAPGASYLLREAYLKYRAETSFGRDETSKLLGEFFVPPLKSAKATAPLNDARAQ